MKFRQERARRLAQISSEFRVNFPLHFSSYSAHDSDHLLPPSPTLPSSPPASSTRLVRCACPSACDDLERAPANRGLALCICFRAAISDLPTAVRCLALALHHDRYVPATPLLVPRHVCKTRCNHIWCALVLPALPACACAPYAKSAPAHLSTGGLNTCSRALAALLVPPEGEPLVSVRFHPSNSPDRLTLICSACLVSAYRRQVLCRAAHNVRVFHTYCSQPCSSFCACD